MEWKNFSEDEAIGCDICTQILQFLNDHKNGVKFNFLEGQMRTKDITTTTYHIDNHLVKADMVKIEKKGAIRKERFVKITEKGVAALSKTLNK